MKFRVILIVSTIVSILFAAYFFQKWSEQKSDNTRLHNNFDVLSAEIKASDLKHTMLLELTKKEINKSFPELVSQIKADFDIKLKNVQVVSNTITQVNHTFKTTIKDSIRLDTIPIQNISYKDDWIDFQAQKLGDDFIVNKNLVTVPLLQVIHKDRWRLKYIFKKRPLFQDIKSENPYAKIQFSRVIQLSK
jgi:hypothetical protein